VVKPVLLYLLGSLGIFLQNHLGYIHEFWKGKHMILILLLSIPISLCYYHAWNILLQKFESLWTVKFIFLGMSYMTFPIFTYIFFSESPFTLKNFICILLSFAIISVQFNLK